jgi:hypothetical protein
VLSRWCSSYTRVAGGQLAAPPQWQLAPPMLELLRQYIKGFHKKRLPCQTSKAVGAKSRLELMESILLVKILIYS